MADNLPATTDGNDFGPAMKALSPQYRAFVLALCTTAGGKAAEAARQAGYVDNHNGSIKVQGMRVKHKPEVQAAIREVCLQRITLDLPVLVDNLFNVATNTQHKDQVKAALALINRGGLPDVTERNININVTVSKEEKVAEIRAMAEEMGLDPEKLLGNISDAEFTEIPAGLEGVW